MTNQWLRLWHDMPTDPKFRTIARIANQRIGDVIAVYVYLLVQGSCNAMKRGVTQCNAHVTQESVSSNLDIPIEDVISIINAMQGRVLEGDYLIGWEKRQPKREDNSTARVKLHRMNKNNETQSNAMKRNETQSNVSIPSPPCSPLFPFPTPLSNNPPIIPPHPKKEKVKKEKLYSQEFENFWQQYPPNGASKAMAAKAFQKAICKEKPEEIISKILDYKNYCKKTSTPVAHATTWLNQERWTINYQQLQGDKHVQQNGNYHQPTKTERLNQAARESAKELGFGFID